MFTNQQTERHKLHHQLIVLENRPCSNPKCLTPFDRREVHRIIPELGYIESNVLVLCFFHHRQAHPNSKFRIGDRVSVNGRTPAYIDLPRHRPRHIISIRYDRAKQCNYYTLGSNGRGANSRQGNPLNGFTDYEFRSYMLMPIRNYHFIKHRKEVNQCQHTLMS